MFIARPTWDQYFLRIADVIGERGTCDRGRIGCVIVRDNRILTTGYVGAPKGLPHCDEIGHLMHTVINEDGTESRHCVRTTHAEQNAILQAALHGVSLEGATIYAKFEPCLSCVKSIINAGIKRIVCQKRYHAGQLSREFLEKAGVKLDVIEDKVEEYKDQ